MFAKQTSGLLRRSPLLRQTMLSLPTIGRGFKRARQPNLVLIGAQKSGTTSLHNYLMAHPDIFMSYFKEPGYFLDHTDVPVETTNRIGIRLGLNDEQLLRYMQIGFRGEKIFGESSTYYSMCPSVGMEVPSNIATRSPDARLIYIVRDPYQRIVSQYLWGLQNNFALGRLEEVVRRRFDLMTAISSYARQLRPFLDHFARDRILVLNFDDLKKQPEQVIAQVLNFLNLPPMPMGVTNYGSFNQSKQRSSFDKRSLLISSALADEIAAVLEPDIKDFSDMTGMDVSSWSVEKIRDS